MRIELGQHEHEGALAMLKRLEACPDEAAFEALEAKMDKQRHQMTGICTMVLEVDDNGRVNSVQVEDSLEKYHAARG